MALETTTNKTILQGNVATTVWPYSFIIPTQDDAVLTFTDDEGTQTVLVPAQYTITGIDDPDGGTVTYPLVGSPMAVGESLTIQRIVAYTQPTVLTNQNNYYPDVVEGADDYIVMQTQQLAERVAASLQFPAVDPPANSVTTLPAWQVRANKFFGFDSSGNLQVTDPSGGSPTSAANVNFLQAGTGAVSRTVQTKLRELPTPGDFGAVGDGVTNDSAAFVLLEGTYTNRLIDLCGLNYLTGTPIPHANQYINGNFVVTSTDDQPNNTAIGTSSLVANTYIPFQFPSAGPNYSAGNYCTAYGYQTLMANTTGRRNTAIGVQALKANTTGYYNTAVGSLALTSNTTGFENTSVGVQSMSANSTGMLNVAVGTAAMLVSTTADNTVAVGHSALVALTTGDNNTAIGRRAMLATNTGTQNVSVGVDSLSGNTTGSNNVAIGYGALGSALTVDGNVAVGRGSANLVTAASNTAVGDQAMAVTTTGTNNTAIGKGAGPTVAANANTLCLGQGAVTDTTNTAKLGLGLVKTNVGGRVFSSQSINAVSDGAGVTYSTGQFSSAMITRTGPGSGFSDTVPTAANIVASIPGCEVDGGYEIWIRNETGQLMTILTNAGVTLAGTTTVASGKSRLYKIRATNIGAGTEAVTVQGVMTGDL